MDYEENDCTINFDTYSKKHSGGLVRMEKTGYYTFNLTYILFSDSYLLSNLKKLFKMMVSDTDIDTRDAMFRKARAYIVRKITEIESQLKHMTFSKKLQHDYARCSKALSYLDEVTKGIYT